MIDSVCANDNLAKARVGKFGNHTPQLGKVGEALGVADEKLAKPDCAVR
jgi:hypothetical protein